MGLLSWFWLLRNGDSDLAIAELRRQLKARRFDIGHLPDREAECRGMAVCIHLSSSPMPGMTEIQVVRKWETELREIRAITVGVAKQFGLDPAGEGKVNLEDGSICFHCGFRSFNIFN